MGEHHSFESSTTTDLTTASETGSAASSPAPSPSPPANHPVGSAPPTTVTISTAVPSFEDALNFDESSEENEDKQKKAAEKKKRLDELRLARGGQPSTGDQGKKKSESKRKARESLSLDDDYFTFNNQGFKKFKPSYQVAASSSRLTTANATAGPSGHVRRTRQTDFIGRPELRTPGGRDNATVNPATGLTGLDILAQAAALVSANEPTLFEAPPQARSHRLPRTRDRGPDDSPTARAPTGPPPPIPLVPSSGSSSLAGPPTRTELTEDILRTWPGDLMLPPFVLRDHNSKKERKAAEKQRRKLRKMTGLEPQVGDGDFNKGARPWSTHADAGGEVRRFNEGLARAREAYGPPSEVGKGNEGSEENGDDGDDGVKDREKDKGKGKAKAKDTKSVTKGKGKGKGRKK